MDFAPVASLPSPLALRLTAPQGAWDVYLDEWIDSLAEVEAIDFDVLVPGHPPLSGTKADVQLYREFLQDSKAAFEAARAAGVPESSDAMTAALTEALAPKYGQVGGFAATVPAIGQAWARAMAGQG